MVWPIAISAPRQTYVTCRCTAPDSVDYRIVIEGRTVPFVDDTEAVLFVLVRGQFTGDLVARLGREVLGSLLEYPPRS
jgi:hypothetical protein